MVSHPGPTVLCGGKTWRLGFNDQDAKGRLEELVRSHVLREALKDRDAIGGEEGEADYQKVKTQLRQGHFLTFEKGWLDLLNSPLGNVLFLLSLLQHNHPDATDADAFRLFREEPDQTQAAIEVVAPHFFREAAIQLGSKPDAAAEFGVRIVANWVAARRKTSATSSRRGGFSKPSAASRGASTSETPPG